MADAEYIRREDRGIIKISGADSRSFLQGLISNDVEKVTPTRAIYAAFLTAQGMFLHEFFVAQIGEALYLDCEAQHLSQINVRFLRAICGYLGITTRLSWSMEYEIAGGKTARLIDLCRQAGADEYVSGPTARGYIDEALFAQEGIRLTFMDYSGYPTYPQFYPPFVHQVSVLDLLFHLGPHARGHMLSFN